MAKCPICGKEYINYTAEDQTNILEIFTNDPNLVVKMCYFHNFNYCPNCAITEMNYTPEQVEILKSKQESLHKILSDDNFKLLDNKNYFRLCELSGYCGELIDDHDKACLGYMAAVDILDNQLLKFIKEHDTNKENNNQEGKLLMPKLGPEDYMLFTAGAEKVNFLNRLVLGHASKAINQKHSVAVNFALVRTLATFNDFEGARNVLNLVNEQIKDKGEPFGTIVKVLGEEIDRAQKTYETVQNMSNEE
ncbi:MAG: hypothetical protein IKB42_02260 [Clostridia bacterium]|nr:hypothetical protein [Clostridia bacterium]